MTTYIYVIRTAPYTYQLPQLDLYESFDLIALHKADPLLLPFDRKTKKKLQNIISVSADVWCAPDTRSIQTAKYMEAKPMVHNQLAEIGYSMSEIISRTAFYDNQGKPKVDSARRSFFSQLVSNRLTESYTQVIKRIEELMDIIQRNNTNLVCISHSFFMKVLETYIRDKKIKNDPHLLLSYYDGSTKAYDFLSGFIIRKENNKFSIEKENRDMDQTI